MFNHVPLEVFLSNRLDFLTCGFYCLSSKLNALEEGPEEELFSDHRREEDIEEGIPPSLTTISYCLYTYMVILHCDMNYEFIFNNIHPTLVS